MWLEVFHAVALLHHSLTAWYIITQVDLSISDDLFVRQAGTTFCWRFFSGWTFAIQFFFLVICVLEDLLQECPSIIMAKVKLRVAEIKNYTFEALVFPLSSFVLWMFWTLYHLDRELVFTRAFDTLMPTWLNHAIHSHIALVLVLEFLLSPHTYDYTRLAMEGLAIYLVLYDSVFVFTYFYDGVWLYPVYGAMSNWLQRVLYMSVGKVFVYGCYFLGRTINSKLWGQTDQQKTEVSLHKVKTGLKVS